MATVRTKFRASSSEAREGTLFYQVIHNRVARQIHTGYRVYPQEWDGPHAGISLPPDAGQSRHAYLSALRTRIAEDTARLGYIISRLDVPDVPIPRKTWCGSTSHLRIREASCLSHGGLSGS